MTRQPLITRDDIAGQLSMVDAFGELPAVEAPAVDVELALIGDPRDFERTPTRPAAPAPAPVQAALLPVDEFTGQLAAIDLAAAITPAELPAPIPFREYRLDMTPTELRDVHRSHCWDSPEYRALSDLVAYCRGTKAMRRAASARLRQYDQRRAIVERIARRAGVDLTAE